MATEPLSLHALQVAGLCVDLGQPPSRIVRDWNFTLEAGRLGALLGASGSGKTTALRAIAGFLPIQAGQIRLGDTLLSSANTLLPPQARRIGFVFQDFALFPHLTATENVAFGLQGLSRRERASRVAECLRQVGLTSFADRPPSQLSGGQQQRLALARALAPRPQMLLLDEPFSGLDPVLRRELATEIRDLLRAEGVTALLVTHSVEEAFDFADRIGIVSEGQLLQWSSPRELYARPAHLEVARLVGRGEFVPARMEQEAGGGLLIDTAWGRTRLPAGEIPPALEARLWIRSSGLRIDPGSSFRAKILSVQDLGGRCECRLEGTDGSHWRGELDIESLVSAAGDASTSWIGKLIPIRLHPEPPVLLFPNGRTWPA